MGSVALIGVGLMGGSLGLALRERAGVAEVRGVDPDPAALDTALAMGAITHAASTVEEAVDGATAAFIAAPVAALPGAARAALAAAGDDCLVSDLGSVKADVLGRLGPDERSRFIGGHPVAGGERTGVAFARAGLFEGATWFLTPGREARPELFERLHALVVALGARPVAIDVEVHDRLMALVSHLPHLIAAALLNQAAVTSPGGREALRSSGPSFVDLTRVAGANPPLWTDILLANRGAVLEAIEGHVEQMTDMADALRAGDRDALRDAVERAAAARERLRAEEPGPAGARWRVLVAVPNHPGVISEIATALGHAHINIEDLALAPGPADGDGELSLAVAGEEAARQAVDLVVARGYRAQSRPAD